VGGGAAGPAGGARPGPAPAAPAPAPAPAPTAEAASDAASAAQDAPSASPAPSSDDGPRRVEGTAVLVGVSEGTRRAFTDTGAAPGQEASARALDFDWLDEEWAARAGYRAPEHRTPSPPAEAQPRRARARWLAGIAAGPSALLHWPAVLALVVCGVLHLPLRNGTPSTYAHGYSLALGTLCLLLGAGLAVRGRAVPVLAAGALFPGLLALAHLTAGRLASPTLAEVLATGGDGATLAAVLAAALALVALLGTSAGRAEGAAGPESSAPSVPVRAADS
jgi:Meckel syndrome type 1 protein